MGGLDKLSEQRMRPNWEIIQREHEAGATYGELAARYGVPKTTIYRRSQEWNNGTTRNDESGTERNDAERRNVRPFRVVRSDLPSIPSAADGANLGIDALVVYLRDHAKTMDLSDHVKAATALSQYNRIIVNALPRGDEAAGDAIITIDTRDLSSERLVKLKAFAQEMKESEQQIG